MTPHSCPWLLEVEGFSETTVVRFLPPAGRNDTIGYYLLGLAEQCPTHLVLNFGAVDYVNSLLMGQLFALAKKVKSLGGQLVLCQVCAALYDLFAQVKLTQLVLIMETEEEALERLEPKPRRRGAVADPLYQQA
jgi:anti-anti-sigma factor